MNVKACLTYHSKTIEKKLLHLPDRRSVFKLYFINLIQRENPERYEWYRSPLTPALFADNLCRLAPEEVGFVTAFPHITKIFRFAPMAETLLHVRAFRTPDLTPLDLAREDGYIEFACYAEAAIAADEYRQWAGAKTVADYLLAFSDFDNGPVVSHTKLGDYVNAKR